MASRNPSKGENVLTFIIERIELLVGNCSYKLRQRTFFDATFAVRHTWCTPNFEDLGGVFVVKAPFEDL